MFDKCSGEMGMVEIDWAIKERLNVSEEGEGLSREGGYGAFFITRSARRIRSTVLNWPQLNKWRQKYRPRQHSRSRKFKGFNWKWLLLVRNELLIRKTLQRGESLIVSRPLHLWYTFFVTFFSELKWGLPGKSGPRRAWMLHCVPAIKVLLVNLTFRFRCRYSFLAPWNWF